MKTTILTQNIESLIKSRTAQVCIIGLGYVGLPLAVALAKSSFSVVGIDNDSKRVMQVNNGQSYIGDINGPEFASMVDKGSLRGVNSFEVLKNADVIIICVPTPITKTKTPDLSYIVAAVEQVAQYLHPNQLIILESTTYPGTTEEVVLPILESSGLQVGKDFYLAFSPERVDPGNKIFTIQNTPKIIGPVTEQCGKLAKLFYETIVSEVIMVSSPKTAETSKLFENVFRNVNIALANELSILCDKMNISVWEVIDAASTKPFGFTRFNPGPGVGGHCIPIDPYYLASKAREFDFRTRFIELAGEVNDSMPSLIVDKITCALNEQGKAVSGSNILILGVAYKKDIDDVRESPALKIINIISERNACLYYSDPYVDNLASFGYDLRSSELTVDFLGKMDCVIIVTDHSIYNYAYIVKHSCIVVDTRNATVNVVEGKEKVRY